MNRIPSELVLKNPEQEADVLENLLEWWRVSLDRRTPAVKLEQGELIIKGAILRLRGHDPVKMGRRSALREYPDGRLIL